jgi:hypothetical protein
MYDVLRTHYTFSCPVLGETHVRLSAFRELERLPGASHPAVYRIRFTCSCGGEHPGLVAHDELDLAPLGMAAGPAFLNVMTSKLEDLGSELGDVAARRIHSGEWPWSFFCYLEERPRPIFPSAFWLLAPGTAAGSVGLAVRCPACHSVSVNLVSHAHVDLPFHNDRNISVVPHVFEADAARTVDEFRTELYGGGFDARRLTLE